VAIWFASRIRAADAPSVFRAQVPRDKILFYSDQRKEQECVTFEPGNPARIPLSELLPGVSWGHGIELQYPLSA
jgi:hypothetical protein